MRGLWTFTLAIACLLVLRVYTALASPLLELLGDPGSDAALQPRTLPGGSGAAYFNPALLTEAPAGLTAGFTLLNERIGIELDGRPGTEFAIPEGLMNAAHADGSRFDSYGLPTNLLQRGREKDALREAFQARPRQGAGSGHDTHTYEVVGLVTKFFDDRLAIGFYGMLPNGDFMELRVFYNDEREQYFSNSLHPELYADRMTALSLALGAGVEIVRGLSLGVGTSFSIAADVASPTYVVDTGNLGKILIDLDGGASIGLAPQFGVHYEIAERLHLTANAHAPRRLDVDAAFTFLLPNAVEQAAGIEFVVYYMPWQVALGAAYDLIDDSTQTLTLAGTALYARWSDYVDRHGLRPSPAFAWGDTISPTLGVRYRFQRFATALDLTYVPTPIPEQTGRTNYVDNDRIAGCLVAEYAFLVLGTQISLGAQAQVHSLLERHQIKLATPTRADGEMLAPERVRDELPDDAQLGGEPVEEAQGLQTNNPGWPGFSSGGWVLAAAIYLTLAL